MRGTQAAHARSVHVFKAPCVCRRVGVCVHVHVWGRGVLFNLGPGGREQGREDSGRSHCPQKELQQEGVLGRQLGGPTGLGHLQTCSHGATRSQRGFWSCRCSLWDQLRAMTWQ